jgi:hypothetical protein
MEPLRNSARFSLSYLPARQGTQRVGRTVRTSLVDSHQSESVARRGLSLTRFVLQRLPLLSEPTRITRPPRSGSFGFSPMRSSGSWGAGPSKPLMRSRSARSPFQTPTPDSDRRRWRVAAKPEPAHCNATPWTALFQGPITEDQLLHDREWPPTSPLHSVIRFEKGVGLCFAPVILGVREAGRERTSVGPRPSPDAQIGVATPERAKGLNMIEVASEPANLSSWDGVGPPFYLEIFGETSPALDANYAEVVPRRTRVDPCRQVVARFTSTGGRWVIQGSSRSITI